MRVEHLDHELVEWRRRAKRSLDHRQDGLRALCFNHEKKTGDSQRAGRMPRYQMSTHVMRSERVISGVESVMERFDAIGKTLMRRAHAADFGS